jgi:tetratricopeptide (TPR) repeat protein
MRARFSPFESRDSAAEAWRNEEALIYAKQAASLNPSYSKAFFRQGQILCDQGRYSEALVAFFTARVHDPSKEIVKNIQQVASLAAAAQQKSTDD